MWLGTSPALGATLTLPLVQRRRFTAVLSVAALDAYFALHFWMIVAELRRRGQRSAWLRVREVGGGGAAYLTHSIGLAWCMANALGWGLTGTRYVHDKTEG